MSERAGVKGRKRNLDKTRNSTALAGRPLAGAESYSARSGSRSDYVYGTLLGAIRSGKLIPGDRVREEDVAQSLGVSRTPVREALQLLQARRLVEDAPGRGIIVVELTRLQVLELYAMREVLEGAAARFAANYASPAEISLMHQLLNEFEGAEGDPSSLGRINAKLHQTIYEAARNRYVQEALANLQDSLSLLPNTTFSLPERFDPAKAEHRAVVEAIEHRDSDRAEAAGRVHIREAQKARLSMLSRASDR
jgi:DNA-binding GntR family transcriptional regulator